MVEYGEAEKNEKGGRQEGLPGEIFRVGPSSVSDSSGCGASMAQNKSGQETLLKKGIAYVKNCYDSHNPFFVSLLASFSSPQRKPRMAAQPPAGGLSCPSAPQRSARRAVPLPGARRRSPGQPALPAPPAPPAPRAPRAPPSSVAWATCRTPLCFDLQD